MVNFTGNKYWMLTKHGKCLSRTCLPTATTNEHNTYEDATMKHYIVNKWNFLCPTEDTEKFTMTAFYSFV